jgi:hypothetical protein
MWLKASTLPGVWLLLIVLSWDTCAAVSGGNVELVLLAAIMVAARLLWSATASRDAFDRIRSARKAVRRFVFCDVSLMFLVARRSPGAPRPRQLAQRVS